MGHFKHFGAKNTKTQDKVLKSVRRIGRLT